MRSIVYPASRAGNIVGMIPRWILLFHILNTSSNTFPVQEVESWPCAAERMDLQKVIE